MAIVGDLMFGFAVFSMWGLSLLLFISSIYRLINWELSAGRVIDNKGEGKSGKNYIHPVVQFTAKSGEEISFTSKQGSLSKEYEEGDKVTVIYNPSDFEKAQIKSFMRLWFFPIALALSGIPFAYAILERHGFVGG